MSHLPAVPQDFSLADDPRATTELSPVERQGRLAQNWADYERTANPNTLRSYRSGIAKLVAWHDANGIPYTFPRDPVSPRVLAQWVDDRGENLKPASLEAYLGAIGKMHVLAGYSSPTATLPVKNAKARLKKDLGAAQKQAAPLRYDTLAPVLADLDTQGAGGSLIALRDAALLSVAYDTLGRRSEIAALNVEDINATPDGYSATIRRSKTDQGGEGFTRFIAPDTYARVTAYLEATSIEDGALFIPMSTVDKDGASDRLSGADVGRIIRRHCGAEFTGHSMRVGSVQDQLAANVDTVKAMQAGGWKSPVMVARYGKDLNAQQSGAAVVAKLQGRLTP